MQKIYVLKQHVAKRHVHLILYKLLIKRQIGKMQKLDIKHI